MKRAVQVAESNQYYPKWRLGSLVVKGGSVLNTGRSRKLSEPSQCDFSGFISPPRVSLHAEIDALRGAPRASGGTLYVARVGRNGKVAMARPCENCQESILDAGITKVVYSIGPGEYGVWDTRKRSVA